MSAILEAGNSSLEHVIKTTVYLTDMENYPVFNRIYEEFFSKNLPARVLVGVASLPKKGKL